MEKRVLFRSAWLPWLLVAPQMAVVLVFFFWPASQAIVQSLQTEDAFGTSTVWVGLDNFVALFEDAAYLESFKVTALFSVLVAGLGIAVVPRELSRPQRPTPKRHIPPRATAVILRTTS